MKKFLSLTLILCMLIITLGGCSSGDDKGKTASKAKNKTENPEWMQIYMDFIDDNKKEFTSEGFVGTNYLGLNDLNFDGVPELIFSDGAAGAAFSVGVFQIIDKKVECICGFTRLLDEEKLPVEDLFLYSTFSDGWLAPRENINTGELKYVMYTGNGNESTNFGNVISFVAGKDGKIKITNEFDHYVYDDTEEGNFKPDSQYNVLGKSVSEKEYIDAKVEFESTWADLESQTWAMVNENCKYSKAKPVSLEKEDIEKLFKLYKKEY